jgi:hypothetical protein
MPNRQYALVVDGELSDELSKWFAGMPPPRKVGGLHGQAELRGLLQRIAKLGHGPAEREYNGRGGARR